MAVVFAVLAVVRGFVLSTLWGWFMVPIFGPPSLSIAAAIGIGIMLTYLLMPPPQASKETEEKADREGVKGLGFVLARSGFTLLLGYIVHLFM